jgi:peptide deformylase
MVIDILQIGHPTLRKKANELLAEQILSEEIQTLIANMCDTMRAAPGVGLAAPQIDSSLQIIVIEDKPEYTQGVPAEQLELRERRPVPLHILINPKIIISEPRQVEFFEGCLSVEGFIAMVPRFLKVTVEAFNEKAERIQIEARGWYARILQHEVDHLHGTLCTDRMDAATLTTMDNYLKYRR